ncbi:hypothetical protein ACKFKG_14875 [Phormidesmis sp. 146-35]
MFRDVLNQRRRVIGLFSNRETAGKALDRLVLSGFPIAQAFLIGHDGEYTESTVSSDLAASPIGAITGTATGLKKGFVLGNLIGGTSGLLLGAGLLALPGVGQVVLSSAIAFTLLSGGICTAAGGLVGALIGLGLTSEQAKKYSQQVANGNILLIVEGTAQEIDRAQQLLKKSVV